MKTYEIPDTEEVCANCEHYIQHYRRIRDYRGVSTFSAVNAGHCTYPKVKERKPCDSCKDHFKRAIEIA